MQIKRSVVPTFWPIERKTKKYAITPQPGPHSKGRSIPLGVILRDMLRYVHTAKEAKRLLNGGTVNVDGHIRKSKNFPVGLMDILTIGEENYRLLPNEKGFYLQKVDDNETNVKLAKIVSKTTVKNGRTQLNLFDGRNLLVDKGEYNTGDTVIMDLQKSAVKQLIKMKKGSLVLVVGGKNAGKKGRIEEITTVKMHPAQVTIETEDEKIIVPKDYVFVVGEKEAVIKIGE